MTESTERLTLTTGRRRILTLVVGALLVAGVVGLMGLPTGASSAAAVVPRGDHVESTATVLGARVMLVSRDNELHLFVAYHRHEGWHGVEVPAPPPDTALAWAATKGGSGVPALSAAYGHSTAARVRVEWVDGRTDDGPVVRGTWLVARDGHVRSKSVTLLAPDGTVVSTMEGP